MSPEVSARIFEPFFTTKGPGKGTGLGLSMVYGVVAESGGRISVDSERDRGTTFTIHLPVADDEAAAATIVPPAQRQLRGTETILLVEDEQPIRELVRKVLVGYGYDVLEASDVTHALEIAERHPAPIHLLLSDIVMPVLSGPDLAQLVVRHRPRDPRALYVRIQQSTRRRCAGRGGAYPREAVYARTTGHQGARGFRVMNGHIGGPPKPSMGPAGSTAVVTGAQRRMATRVLVIEDDAAILESFERLLLEEGYSSVLSRRAKPASRRQRSALRTPCYSISICHSRMAWNASGVSAPRRCS